MKKKLYSSIIHILNNIRENTTIKDYTPKHQKKPNEQKCNACGSHQTRYLIGRSNVKFGGDIWEKQIEQEAADNNW